MPSPPAGPHHRVDTDPRTGTAAALRRLNHVLMAREADTELLGRIATTAEGLADELEAGPRRSRDRVELKRRMFEVEVADGQVVSHFDECFVSGANNPVGLGITVRRDGQAVVAAVRLGPAYEGPPGRAHGGIVAAVFDDVLGYLLTLRQQPGFTAQLTVRYLAPTPLDQPLEFHARETGQEGRKLYTAAEAYADGQLVADAQATFVLIDASRLRP